ncbi:hypothetical protein HPB49_005428 [Dermacentor silvarum]|uniref:Uncharacterized protein n=1 Tax=Dermacentor silvarum TaxID=543639 RepID=A0ACB8D390_DERSI|nr:hypothetical protein HPB49_005428 [Dermacentor silvarum]
MNVDVMWKEIGQIKDFKDELQFRNVAKLAQLCLSIPHANAYAERIFSWLRIPAAKSLVKLAIIPGVVDFATTCKMSTGTRRQFATVFKMKASPTGVKQVLCDRRTELAVIPGGMT